MFLKQPRLKILPNDLLDERKEHRPKPFFIGLAIPLNLMEKIQVELFFDLFDTRNA